MLARTTACSYHHLAPKDTAIRGAWQTGKAIARPGGKDAGVNITRRGFTSSHAMSAAASSSSSAATATNSASSPSSSSPLQPSEEQIQRLKERIHAVRKRIAEASKNAKRDTEPRLVAISKLHPPTSILAAHRHAEPVQIHFGENYAQELEAKARVLPHSIQWHFVGKLQSNKAKMVAGIPNLYLVETLDSEKLATALEKARANLESRSDDTGAVPVLGVYIQINTSGEEAKGGLAPLSDASSGGKDSEVVKLALHVMQSCPHLELRGLMTIGAAANSMANKDSAEQASQNGASMSQQEVAQQALEQNPDFSVLHQTRNVLVQILREHGKSALQLDEAAQKRYATLLPSHATSENDDASGGLELSMGMSNDLEMAVRAGSGNVRVGTDCFGTRPPSRDEAMAGMKHELERDSSN